MRVSVMMVKLRPPRAVVLRAFLLAAALVVLVRMGEMLRMHHVYVTDNTGSEKQDDHRQHHVFPMTFPSVPTRTTTTTTTAITTTAAKVANTAGLQVRPLTRAEFEQGDLDQKPHKPSSSDLEGDRQVAVEDDAGSTICQKHWAQGLEKLFESQLKALRVYIAINLHQNEKVAAQMINQLHRLLLMMDPSKVFISIYESGSTDSTPMVLGIFHNLLSMMQVKHRIVGSKEDVRTGGTQRIEFLAGMRNNALQPLLAEGAQKYDKVLFVNDVFFCAEDSALLLLHNAHIASGFDIFEVDWKSGQVKYYDFWVGRDINGDRIPPYPPWITSSPNKERLEQGLPFRVYCTWNGMVSLDAKLFQKDGLLFRFRNWRGECSSSEMTHFCDDIWAKYGPETRIVIEPRVIVTYDIDRLQDIALAREKKTPKGGHIDLGIHPNPFQKDYMPGLAQLDNFAESLSTIPSDYDVPEYTECCPMPDGTESANEWDLCYKEPTVTGLLHTDPCPQGSCETNTSCPDTWPAVGDEPVFIALTFHEDEPVPNSFSYQIELLAQTLKSRLRVSVVAHGKREHPPWRAHVLGILWSLGVPPLKHQWAAPGEDFGLMQWRAMERHCGKQFVFVVNPHREFCASSILAALSDSQRQPCKPAYFLMPALQSLPLIRCYWEFCRYGSDHT
eukprot:jgi/Chlat1/8730/Chrsp9S00892